MIKTKTITLRLFLSAEDVMTVMDLYNDLNQSGELDHSRKKSGENGRKPAWMA